MMCEAGTVFQLSSFSQLSYVVGPGHVFSSVMWAFPSFSRTARARGKGVGTPTASSRNAAPPVLPASPPPRRASSSLFPLIDIFPLTFVTSSSCLPHCTRPCSPLLPFDLFSLLSLLKLYSCDFTRPVLKCSCVS